MKSVVEYPWAGISLAIPTGFETQTLYEEYQIVVATRIEGKQATQSISLSAFPVDGQVTAKKFSQVTLEGLKTSLATRRLKVLKETTVRIAGLDGAARSMTYSHRGVETAAVGVCFIREVKPPADRQDNTSGAEAPKIRIAYLMTMEVAVKYKDALLRSFDAVVKTVKLTDIHHPIDVTRKFRGPFVKDYRRGYGIRLPIGWVGIKGELGVSLGQTDYLLGGITSPLVQVVSLTVSADTDAKQCGQKAIDFERKHGMKIEILSESPIKLAGRDGYQYVVRKSLAPATQPVTTQPAATQPATAPVATQPVTTQPAATQPATAPAATQPVTTQPADEPPAESVLEVRRLLCIPAEDPDKQRHFAVILSCYDTDVKKVVALMDKLAKGFILIKTAKPSRVSGTIQP
jgi:hypothetical protein